MSRIDQALKRREKEVVRKDEEVAGFLGRRRWPEVESPVVPAWQLERFPIEVPRNEVPRSEVPRSVETHEVAVLDRPHVAETSSPAPVVSDPAPTPVRFRQFNRLVAGKVVGDHRMDAKATEQYRRLAASLHHVQVERGTRKVMITSAVSGEGKTLTALNLAITLSTSYRRRVVLIDANLRSPAIHALLDISNVVGLTEALTETGQMKPVVLELSPRLSVVPAGRPDPDPMGPLTSPRLAMILDEMAQKFDWVIVDTPPVVLLPDTNLLVSMVDAAVVVIDAAKTSCDLIERAVHVIGRQRVLGFVLNNAEAEE
jgi:capsular exopolysaccharide synthesis family protein